MKKLLVPIAILISLALSAIAPQLAQAVVIDSLFTSQWFNHPDGNKNPPPYGLRLEQLFDDRPNGGGRWTWSAEPDPCAASGIDCIGSAMGQSLTDAVSAAIGVTADVRLHDDGTIDLRIAGTMFGGKNAGIDLYDPDNAGLWEVEMIYSENVYFGNDSNGNEFVVVTEQSSANTGYIRPLFDLGVTSEVESETTPQFSIEIADHESPANKSKRCLPAPCDGGNGVPLSLFYSIDNHRLQTIDPTDLIIVSSDISHTSGEPMSDIGQIVSQDGSENYCTDLLSSQYNPALCERYVGRGWLEHTKDYAGAEGWVDFGRYGTNDWLITGQPVPEPTTLALLGAGLAGLGLRRRRRSA